MIPADFEDE